MLFGRSLAMQEHCGCLEFTSIVFNMNCFEKGHMRRKGSFDFHMPVIAKETTSLVFTYSACLQFWLSDKWHCATSSRNKEGRGMLLNNLTCSELDCWTSRTLHKSMQGPLIAANEIPDVQKHKKGSSLHLTMLSYFWGLLGCSNGNDLRLLQMLRNQFSSTKLSKLFSWQNLF